MDTFRDKFFEKINANKLPFLVYLLLGSLPVFLPDSENIPIVFYVFFYFIFLWVWSWLMASWLNCSNLINNGVSPKIFSVLVRQFFFWQVKIILVASVSMLLLSIPIILLFSELYLGLATPEEMRSLQIGLSGRGEFVEPGLSFFTRFILISIIVPLIFFA